MNIVKLAKALGVDTTCSKEEIKSLRENLGISIDAARELILEPRILQRIKLLVGIITEREYD